MANFHVTADGKRLIDLDRVIEAARTESLDRGDGTVLYLQGGRIVQLAEPDASLVWTILRDGPMSSDRCPKRNSLNQRCAGPVDHVGSCNCRVA